MGGDAKREVELLDQGSGPEARISRPKAGRPYLPVTECSWVRISGALFVSRSMQPVGASCFWGLLLFQQ